MEQHNLYLPFLDIMINKDPENDNIWMDIFCKKTDTLRYVPFNSCHPKQCKKNIPFTLARRICIIVENKKVRKKRLDELQKLIVIIWHLLQLSIHLTKTFPCNSNSL